MTHSLSIKEEAISLRKEGASLMEISKKLALAKSTASKWLRNTLLPTAAQRKIQKKLITGREKGLALMKLKRARVLKSINKEAFYHIKKIRAERNKDFLKLVTSLLFWCEGTHSTIREVRFINSDPRLVMVFLFAFRSSFQLDESKFRALVHIHEYHDDIKQKLFWSKITAIPLSQFTKSYLKPHTGDRKREDYPGCLSIRYGDSSIAKMIAALYHAFAERVSKQSVKRAIGA